MERRVKLDLENTFLMLPLYELGENFVILLLIIFLLQFSIKSLFRYKRNLAKDSSQGVVQLSSA